VVAWLIVAIVVVTVIIFLTACKGNGGYIDVQCGPLGCTLSASVETWGEPEPTTPPEAPAAAGHVDGGFESSVTVPPPGQAGVTATTEGS
jgi:hypothetical protein